MQSAFGIDHGDISKGAWGALRRVGTGFPKRTRLTRAQVQTQGAPGSVTRPQKMKDTLSRAGDTPVTVKGVGRAASRGTGKVSTLFENHPGLTGTALVGGGGAAGYHYLRKEPKKKS